MKFAKVLIPLGFVACLGLGPGLSNAQERPRSTPTLFGAKARRHAEVMGELHAIHVEQARQTELLRQIAGSHQQQVALQSQRAAIDLNRPSRLPDDPNLLPQRPSRLPDDPNELPQRPSRLPVDPNANQQPSRLPDLPSSNTKFTGRVFYRKSF